MLKRKILKLVAWFKESTPTTQGLIILGVLLVVGIIQNSHGLNAHDLIGKVSFTQHASVQGLEQFNRLLDDQLDLFILIDHLADIETINNNFICFFCKNLLFF